MFPVHWRPFYLQGLPRIKFHSIPCSSFHVVIIGHLHSIDRPMYSDWVFSCFLTSGTRKCPVKALRKGQTLEAMLNMESYQLHKFFFLSTTKPWPKESCCRKDFSKIFWLVTKLRQIFLVFFVFLCSNVECQHSLNRQGCSQFCMSLPGCARIGKIV